MNKGNSPSRKMYQINRLLFHKYAVVASSCKHASTVILAGILLKTSVKCMTVVFRFKVGFAVKMILEAS